MLVLTVFAFTCALSPRFAFAAGEKRVSSWSAIDGNQTIYLNDFHARNGRIVINDTTHFSKGGAYGDYGIILKTGGAATYGGSPFYLEYDNAGYTVDGRAVDVRLTCVTARMTSRSEAGDTVLRLEAANAGWQPDNVAFTSQKGSSNTYRMTVYYHGTDTKVPNARWVLFFEDLDTRGSEGYVWSSYAEGVRLDSNYDTNNVYIATNSTLQIGTDGGKPYYIGSQGTTGADEEFSSGVAFVAQNDVTFTYRIYSSGAATGLGILSTPLAYPSWDNPVKSPDSQYAVLGENVTFEVAQTFPYVASSNAAKSATFSDTLDAAFDASSATIKVMKGTTDVTSSGGWTLSRSGQTVSVTTTKCGHGQLEGEYRFAVTARLKVDADVSGNAISGSDRVLKNKASVMVTPQSGSAQTHTSNEVEVKLHRSLTVKKLVTGTGGEIARPFTFTLTIKNGASTWKAETFTLKAGESHVISEVPVGCAWSVSEDAESRYDVTWENQTGTVGASNVVATATNTRKTGSISVSKAVENANSVGYDHLREKLATERFGFRIVVTGDLCGTPYAFKDETFTLAQGETKTFDDIPSEFSYVVTEVSGAEHYDMSSTGATGTVAAKATSAATFTNVRHGFISVEKVLLF